MTPPSLTWPPSDDAEVRLARQRLRELADELSQRSSALSIAAREDEGGTPFLEVSVGDTAFAEVHLVSETLDDASGRMYGLIGDFEEITAEDFAGTKSEIVARLLEIASPKA
ncbi:MAG: hypothetical protein K2X38_04100 [Gemmataceae bacterium]|nr:hypothetical protein [Gemmataceae bacterium]